MENAVDAVTDAQLVLKGFEVHVRRAELDGVYDNRIFISGFIVLFDRSIRPGDVITIGDKLGWVQELHARYVALASSTP